MSTVTLQDVENHPGYIFLLSLCAYDYDDTIPWPTDWVKEVVELANKVGCMDAIRSFWTNSPQEWFDKSLDEDGNSIREKYVNQRRYGFVGIVTSHLAHVNSDISNLNETIKDLTE